MRRSVLALLIAALVVIASAGLAAATSSTDSQANPPQVAGDATSNATARFSTHQPKAPTIVIAFGPKVVNGAFTFAKGARAYYANLAGRSASNPQGLPAPEVIAVSISDDNGASWFDPVVAANSHGNVFNDKESIWADRNPASPFFGRVYASYSEFRPPTETAEPIVVVFSADGGLHWSGQNQVSTATNNAVHGRRQ